MNLVQLFDVLYRRQRRVLVLVAVGVFVAAALVTFALPKEYRGVATLFVGENRPLSAGADAVQLDDVLARTYAELLTAPSFQRRVAERLPGGASPQDLSDALSVKVVPGTRLLEIRALHEDPRQARDLANSYATTFVETQQQSLTEASRGRLNRLSRRIGELALELDQLEGRPDSQAAARRAQIGNELASLRQAYRATQESNALQGSNVSVSSLSAVPSSPAKPRTKLYLGLGLVLALLLGVVAALVRNSFDKRVRDEQELTRLLGDVPVLARVPLGRSDRRHQRAMDEAFDFLRVNLRLQAAAQPVRVLAVTSSLPGDGKSTVCTRLSRAFARLGAAVVAVDCDLRKPMLGSYMGADDSRGLTNLLVDGAAPVEMLADSAISGVRVLPSGPIPPNPSVLLGLPRFQEVIEDLRANADYVVVDTPPVPAGVDTSAISQVVDGVVLVIDLERSNRDALEVTRVQLEQSNARLIGVVLNRVPDRLMQYGYGGEYYEGPDVDYAPSLPSSGSRRTPARAR